MSLSYDVFYWRKFSPLVESALRQPNTDVRLLPKADIVQPLNDLCLTHTRPFECASLGGYDALS
jgi:hypothetical protein